MDTVFVILGVPLTGFGLGAAAALLAGMIVAGGYVMRHGSKYGDVVRFILLAIPLCWLFARLFYVLANCTYYLTTMSNPGLALRFWDGGYAVTGAIAGAVLAARLTERWRHAPRGTMMDAAGLGIPVAIVVERLMEQGTGMGLGRAIYTDWMTKLPFFAVMDETGELVHAVYRYEAVAAALIFIGVVLWLATCKHKPVPKGDVLLIVLTLLGSSQVLLESMRNDGHMVVHFVRINQVLFMTLPVIALTVWTKRIARKNGSWKGMPIISWLVTAVAIVMGVAQEFRIDSSENLWLDYGLMALCLTIVAATALLCRRKAAQST